MIEVHKGNTIVRLLWGLCIFTHLSPAMSEDMDAIEIGHVQAFSGQVWITREGSLRPSSVNQVPFPLYKGDSLEAKVDSEAIIQLTSEVSIILPENSVFQINDQNSQKLESGRVAYKVKPKKRLRGINVETKAAVIGVKGTEFLAKQTSDVSSVILSKGQVELLPMKEQFIRFKEQQLSEFEAYRKKLRGDFELYKQEQNKQYKEYLSSISMSGGQSFAIDTDNKVDEIEPSEEDKRLLKRLNEL